MVIKKHRGEKSHNNASHEHNAHMNLCRKIPASCRKYFVEPGSINRDKAITSQKLVKNAFTLKSLKYDGDKWILVEKQKDGSMRQMLVTKVQKLFSEIGKAIACSHNAGWQHSNVHLENILIVKEGEELVPKIIDWGRAIPFKLNTRPRKEILHNRNNISGKPKWGFIDKKTGRQYLFGNKPYDITESQWMNMTRSAIRNVGKNNRNFEVVDWMGNRVGKHSRIPNLTYIASSLENVPKKEVHMKRIANTYYKSRRESTRINNSRPNTPTSIYAPNTRLKSRN